jgi:hypothetical protein
MSKRLANRIAGGVTGFGIPISVASDIVKSFPPTFISMGTDSGRASSRDSIAIFGILVEAMNVWSKLKMAKKGAAF